MNHIVVAFATYEWQLYFGMVFGILSFCVTTLCRSIMSKLVEPHEVGKVFAVVGAIQVSTIFIFAFVDILMRISFFFKKKFVFGFFFQF